MRSDGAGVGPVRDYFRPVIVPAGVAHRRFNAARLKSGLVIDFVTKNYHRIGRDIVQITAGIVRRVFHRPFGAANQNTRCDYENDSQRNLAHALNDTRPDNLSSSLLRPLISKEPAEEGCRGFRDTGDFVRCLTIKFEIQLGLRSTIVPLGKAFELAAPESPLDQRSSPDRDANARRLPRDPELPGDGFGRGDNSARNQAWAAFVLARENENCIAFSDLLAAVHRLLRVEHESPRAQIADFRFDHKRHVANRDVDQRLVRPKT